MKHNVSTSVSKSYGCYCMYNIFRLMFAETCTIYVASAALWMQYISISDSKLFPKFIGQKTKKKRMFGGNKNIHSLCMYPQSSQMKYDSSRFLWMSNIILEENGVYVFTLASHPIPPLLHTLLLPSCLCARERASKCVTLVTN